MGASSPRTVSFDFDGVIHSAERGYQEGKVYGDLDFSGIRAFQERGYCIVVASAGGVERAAKTLESQGFTVRRDPLMENTRWSGGFDGSVILVQPKCAAVAYIDDRAINHQFGANWGRVLDRIGAMDNHGRAAIAETKVYRAE